ncbi:dienelactone hydrolase family protein [Streptomyces tsukubensis]|uniref:Dienelactone hydrolase domain-containing protein n=1 Tax=Streptomyces tsukubensis TaxID=83656 RepID=A0A1V4AF51_9ACTN|nr:dienelactone hydrolase family protein [Streptomyces tsukubensis]OON82696.1 hypothetical protein B1H18_01180 [Streptomyces tsukubensis]QFR92130.1 dienelactone hydrolase [Streptomyces tsukubensis]
MAEVLLFHHAERTGSGTLVERGEAAAQGLPPGLVHAGFSPGVLPAQKLAQTRPGAKGALLLEACVPVTEFGEAWPRTVPVRIHGMDADEFSVGEGDIVAARALVESAPDAELFLCPGDRHLFTDRSLPGYDASAAKQLMERVLDFLRTVDGDTGASAGAGA